MILFIFEGEDREPQIYKTHETIYSEAPKSSANTIKVDIIGLSGDRFSI